MGLEFTAVCEGCCRTVDLRTDDPSALVGWQIVEVRDGATLEDMTAHDLMMRCPACVLPASSG